MGSWKRSGRANARFRNNRFAHRHGESEPQAPWPKSHRLNTRELAQQIQQSGPVKSLKDMSAEERAEMDRLYGKEN